MKDRREGGDGWAWSPLPKEALLLRQLREPPPNRPHPDQGEARPLQGSPGSKAGKDGAHQNARPPGRLAGLSANIQPGQLKMGGGQVGGDMT